MAGVAPPGPGMMPPGAPPPGGAMPRPPMPMPPGMPGMPPGGPPPVPGGAPPMGGPPMPPPTGGNPFSDPFVDVSDALPAHWQMVDAMSRIGKQIVATGAFYREPDILAWLKNFVKEADRIITSYSQRKGLDLSGSPMGDDAKIVEPEDAESDEDSE